MTTISDKAFALIVEYEGCPARPYWPGGASGITIGIGYDLGYRTLLEYVRDWGERLPATAKERLAHVIGKRGDAAQTVLSDVRDINIPKEAAAAVLRANTIPWAISETRRVFPGVERLPQDAAGALVSLVFNRGGSMSGASRQEMRAIQKAVLTGDLREIAAQLRAMKRLWVGRNLDGLLKRRDAEARLVESCIVS